MERDLVTLSKWEIVRKRFMELLIHLSALPDGSWITISTVISSLHVCLMDKRKVSPATTFSIILQCICLPILQFHQLVFIGKRLKSRMAEVSLILEMLQYLSQ